MCLPAASLARCDCPENSTAHGSVQAAQRTAHTPVCSQALGDSPHVSKFTRSGRFCGWLESCSRRCRCGLESDDEESMESDDVILRINDCLRTAHDGPPSTQLLDICRANLHLTGAELFDAF